jgi:hypothetical protein
MISRTLKKLQEILMRLEEPVDPKKTFWNSKKIRLPNQILKINSKILKK